MQNHCLLRPSLDGTHPLVRPWRRGHEGANVVLAREEVVLALGREVAPSLLVVSWTGGWAAAEVWDAVKAAWPGVRRSTQRPV